MSEWRVNVGQVSLMAGRRRDQAGGVRVSEMQERRRRRDRGRLCILVEVSGEAAGREALAQQLALQIEQEYLRRRESITSALQQALLAANRLLYQSNRDSLPQERRTAGATCLVIRDADIYIAQSGPALAYLFREGQIARYPERSPWLDGTSPAESGATPLGSQETAQVDLFHIRAQVWDTFLVSESGLAGLTSAHDLAEEVGTGGVQASLDTIARLAGKEEITALVVALDGPDGEAAEGAAPGTLDTSIEPAPRRALSGETVQGILGRIPVESILSQAGQATRTAGKAVGHGVGTLLRQMVPSPEPDVKRPARRPGLGLFRSVMIVLAILIPVLVGVAVVSVLLLQPEAAPPVPQTGLLDEANRLRDEAIRSNDPAAVRTLLSEAQNLLDQVLAAEPDNSSAVQLRSLVQMQLDQVDRVHRLARVGLWKQYGNGSNPSRVVVNGTDVFVLDQGLDQVYHHELDPIALGIREGTLDRVLLRKGQSVGGVVVGELVDMTWVPVGRNREVPALIILHQGGGLIAYDPATDLLSSLVVGGVDTWQSPRLIAGYDGRLYVLDEQRQQILRYWPTADGYSGVPDNWLVAPTDLSDVIDMSIGEEIYLLHSSGRLERLAQGQPTQFDLAGWTAPLQNPSALFTGSAEYVASLYVADRGNNRIVQCGKDGPFQRQFKLSEGDALRDVTSLFVDELGGTGTAQGMILFLSRQTLYIATIPGE